MASSNNNNPWQDQESTNHQAFTPPPANVASQQAQATQNPWQLQGPPIDNQSYQYTAPSDPWTAEQQHGGYAPPAGPPPGQARSPAPPSGHTHSQAPKLPDETAKFIPESEQGEQREALEQFEMSHHQQLSPDERNIELLTQQFPKLDGALVAAIYGDSKDMGASREMLGELNDQME